jgi:hypothetical protein
MAKINLRDLYPNDYDFDCFITVPDAIADTFILNMTKEIADVYVDAYREEAAYIRRRTRNKAYYSTESEEWLGHSDFAITANIYAHLEFNSKLVSAGAMSWIEDTSLGVGKKSDANVVSGFATGKTTEAKKNESAEKPEFTGKTEV